ncbi:putative serine/threonine protein kinase [Leptomonas pyrrhocoris]|uniref:Putative serine/threonine protein kinase n=1 Tax=Leptomonas pyrrhocoris TaxID=157538 RepID=A0A0N0DTX9_LEPPY|nr:putative serine/threonine protein kinase [Leptomonas pyrrhocoris]KPA78118.1 putative serine/threonine protein kinase [Leptomonas pyrrhocoris]|eukprot:XP_015656557.1 putative serine/threonine protein kinase [Leptomonas pyrrhocoris]
MHRKDGPSPKDEADEDDDGTSAFTGTSNPNPVEAEGDHWRPQTDAASNSSDSGARNFHRGGLRIELPHSSSPPCTAPASPAEATTATTNESQRTAVYRNPDSVAFHREMEECTPTSVAEQHARQSAMALLHADISSKAHLSLSMGPASSRPPLHTSQPSLSPAVAGGFEMSEVPKKKTALQQLFNVRTRKNRSTLSSSSHAFLANSCMEARETSAAVDFTSGGDQEPHLHPSVANISSTPRPSSVNSEPQLPRPLGSSRLAASLSSMERLHGGASSTTHPLPPMPASIPLTSSSVDAAAAPPGATDDDAEDSSSSSGQNIGMEAVLRDASKVRGIRLTWLLYLLTIMVIVLFTLLLVQIIYESNRTLVRTTTQAVRAQASLLLNSVDLEEYALTNVFARLHELSTTGGDSSNSTYVGARDSLCSRLYGAPMAFATYNAAGDMVWRMRCSLYPSLKSYYMLPDKMIPSVEAVRITDYTWDTTLAQRSYYNETDGTVNTFVMLMDKDTVGRTLMSNNFPQYSTSTLQYVTAAFLTRMWNGTEPKILFHTLTESRQTYTATENGTVRDGLAELFHAICYEGSPYVWHTVTHYRAGDSSASGDDDDPPKPSARWPLTTTNAIPSPHLEYGRSWGQLSLANLCGVQCSGGADDTTCDFDNPTNIWFVIEYSLIGQNSLSSILNVVGVVSIVALVIFSFVLFLVYISITVPVNFLRVQLLKAVGATDTQTNLQRKIVRWTCRLWLGDLTAVVRSIHILSLCFQLNKKYVPDHVLRNHAAQLYLRRRKFNFLEDVDLKEDHTDRDDTESESDLGPALAVAPLPGVSTVMPAGESRFLWRFGASNEADAAARHSADFEALALSENQSGATTAGAAAVRPAIGNVPPLTHPRGLGGSVSPVAFVKSAKSMARMSTSANDSVIPPWPMGEVDSSFLLGSGGGGGTEQELSLAMSTVLNPRNSLNAMAIRRESESTILCVRIASVELAYLLNYSAAVVQHRRIMRILLHRIRRYKGALFHRSGDSLAAVWNAFEGCPNHAEMAAICAQEIANAFAPLRVDGLHVGLVLHQGSLVCGTVEYSKAAFVTAFGDGPREAFALVELASTVGSLNVIVTEPVKQSLSGLYNCNIVDVIQLPNSTHPLLLFELGSSRCHYPATPPTPRAQFAVEYARVFSQFRNHEFSEALQGIEHIRASLRISHHEHLLRRLERLCFFFATAPAALPYPYTRAFPAWVNYEAIAQAGLRNDAHFHAAPFNNSFMSHSFMEGVVYKGVPTVRNEVEYIEDFKQELQENMRRTAQKGNGSPTLDESSTRPHVTPQPSPSMRPAADLTSMSEERAVSVGSGIELMDSHNNNSNVYSSAASPKSRHVDVTGWKTAGVAVTAAATTPIEVPTPIATSVAAAVPPLFNLPSSPAVPLLTFDALHLSGTAEPVVIADRASSCCSSAHTMDSPRDVFALSNRFALTQRVTNRPPVALAAASPTVMLDLTGERPVAERQGQHGNGNLNDSMSNSNIQSADMSFKRSVNNELMLNGGGSGVGTNTHTNMHSFSVSSPNLPAEIKAKSGTTYLRSTRILGKGSFGCVYLGMDAHSGRLVAIKFLPMPRDESGVEEIEAEVLILQRVNDTHVVQLLSYAFEGDTIVIIMECMLAGSLQNMISAFGGIPSSTARVFMRDVLRGLSKIHSMGVIHRDMKPQNVLLSLAGNCKISDFGASAWLQELARKESQGQVCGTPVYLAPEAARGSSAKESDIWSCGIMFLQMITGALPYPPEQLSAGAAVLVFQIGSGIAQPQIPDNLDVLDAEFVRACLQEEPRKRLTAAALLQLPIFTV